MSKDKPLLGEKIDTWLRKEVFMIDYEGFYKIYELFF